VTDFVEQENIRCLSSLGSVTVVESHSSDIDSTWTCDEGEDGG